MDTHFIRYVQCVEWSGHHDTSCMTDYVDCNTSVQENLRHFCDCIVQE